MNLMDRSDTYPSAFGNIREVVFEGYLQSSQMSDAERCTIIMLLDKLRPECAIEVGTAGGGSLSMIARYAKKAYSLDIDPTCRERFHSRFPNVEFIVGDSKETLPRLLRTLEASNEKLAFVLIDGLHTSEGVKADIENLLAYKPTCPLYVALHDSFNPECRSGMAAADWASSPFVHHVELDFVGGQFNRIETNGTREMWCGLALALMLPEPRQGELGILTGGDDQVHLQRLVLEQKGEGMVNGFGINHVVVVKDEDEILRDGGDFIEQGCQNRSNWRGLR